MVGCYLIAVETVLNVVFKFVPSACTVPIIATAMPADEAVFDSRGARLISDESGNGLSHRLLLHLLPSRGQLRRPHAVLEEIPFARVNLTAEFS
jgi:hypothetical protein